MKINLITKEQFDRLMSIQKSNPTLTYQNKGYDYINPKDLSDSDKEAIKEVTNILSDSVHGFSRFNNFKINKAGKIQIRLQYDYNYDGQGLPFTGVGYILVEELLNGFLE